MPDFSKENHSQSSANFREHLEHSKTSVNVRAESEQISWKGDTGSNPERGQ